MITISWKALVDFLLEKSAISDGASSRWMTSGYMSGAEVCQKQRLDVFLYFRLPSVFFL